MRSCEGRTLQQFSCSSQQRCSRASTVTQEAATRIAEVNQPRFPQRWARTGYRRTDNGGTTGRNVPGSHPHPRLTLSRHEKVGKLDRMRQLWSWPEPGCQRWWSCWSGSGRPGSSLGEAKGVWRGYAACCRSRGKCFNHLTRTLEQHSAPWNDCVQTEEQRPGGVSVTLHGGGRRSFSSELRLLRDPLQVPDGVRSGPTSTSLALFIDWPVNTVSFSRLHVIPVSPCDLCEFPSSLGWSTWFQSEHEQN